jgi:hypothetical protein
VGLGTGTHQSSSGSSSLRLTSHLACTSLFPPDPPQCGHTPLHLAAAAGAVDVPGLMSAVEIEEVRRAKEPHVLGPFMFSPQNFSILSQRKNSKLYVFPCWFTYPTSSSDFSMCLPPPMHSLRSARSYIQVQALPAVHPRPSLSRSDYFTAVPCCGNEVIENDEIIFGGRCCTHRR